MLDIQINGIYTYVDNVKTLKIGDKIKLIPNPNNKISTHAIGAYTLDNKKIGYVPFKVFQIDINLIYTVSKISLNQKNPLLLISINFNNSNFILIDNKPDLSMKIYNDDVSHFKQFLSRNNHDIQDIYISYMDDNYIDLTIKSDNKETIFNTVSKQYYESNIFKYDEFYNYKLTTSCIYQPFLIHSLDSYIIKNYNYIDKILKKKNKKLNEINITFDIINDNITIENNNYLCYNHNMKAYCYINYYDNDTIYDIIYNDEYNNVPVYLIKILISNKNNIVLYNPLINKTYKLEINEIILSKLN
jgi:hypothetical protein